MNRTQANTESAHARMTEAFKNNIGRLDGVEPKLAAAMWDILARPGSLVRAVAAYFMALAMGLSEEAAQSLGCGIEYLHTSSLIFDDFPFMDNALLRRGAACLHVIHGEAVATLAALALVNRGYSLLWQSMSRTTPERRMEAGQWVEARLGLHGLLGGQAWDLHAWQGSPNTTDASMVAARKTADLIRLTLVLPAMVGNGTAHEIHLLDRLALLRGLAYQAADDWKDVASAEEHSGKTSGRDEALQRPNLVVAKGFAAASARCSRLIALGDRVQQALPGPAGRWQMLELIRVTTPDLPAPSPEHLPAAA